MKSLITIVTITTAMCISCSSPVDIDTPRDRTAENTHFPLPETQRVVPTSVSITVLESDFAPWAPRTTSSVIVTMDTTFHPPMHWISGLLINNTTGMPKPSILETYFHCDTLTPDLVDTVWHDVKGNMFRILAQRKIGGNITVDTLNSASTGMMAMRLKSVYRTGFRAIADTFQIYFADGANGTPTVVGTVSLKTVW